jgi:hypothetical protein
MQRWLRREALVLAREAAMFDCDAMHDEARELVRITHTESRLIVLQSA